MGPRGGSGSGVCPARHAGRAMAADGGGGRELLALIHQHLLRGGFARAARELQAQSGQVTDGRARAAGEAAGRGMGWAVPERGPRRSRRARSHFASSPITGSATWVPGAPRGRGSTLARRSMLHPRGVPVPSGCSRCPRAAPAPNRLPGRASRTGGLVLPEHVLLREKSPGEHAALCAAGRGVGGIRREVCAGRHGPAFPGGLDGCLFLSLGHIPKRGWCLTGVRSASTEIAPFAFDLSRGHLYSLGKVSQSRE